VGAGVVQVLEFSSIQARAVMKEGVRKRVDKNNERGVGMEKYASSLGCVKRGLKRIKRKIAPHFTGC
jgi:hypothetical protein